ncbi:protein of unknown function [Hyphomicrobium sp. MC1]|nr:protein of unknown function [Hyphomicrobium sp. MC1]
MHPDSTYEQGSAKLSIEHQRKQPTEALVESLKPGADSPLLVKPDATIM